MVGPPLSAMDAELAFQIANVQPSMKMSNAQKSARQHAASQEARSMLGACLADCTPLKPLTHALHAGCKSASATPKRHVLSGLILRMLQLSPTAGGRKTHASDCTYVMQEQQDAPARLCHHMTCMIRRAGLDSDQAAVLADVLGGQHSILPSRQIDRGTSLGDILYFCRANASAAPHWAQIASLVDTAARMVAKYRGVAPPPAMQLLVRERIGPMLLKPVRAR